MKLFRVLLEKIASGEFVDAELRDAITNDDLEVWRNTWLPEVEAAKVRIHKAAVPPERRPLDLHWNWQGKVERARNAFLSQKSFCLTCDGQIQGLMLVDLTMVTARIESQKDKPLVYVDYLVTAPWNRKELLCTPRYRLVGSVLIRAAIELSLQEEFGGRIALHSLPAAEDFYASRCGMTSLGKDPKKQNLVYFEMTPQQAEAFRQT